MRAHYPVPVAFISNFSILHSHMTRLSRLTNILLQLQAKRVVTAQDLAEKFGITQRTVYRDIKALEEAGVPIIGEAGRGYTLRQDYRVPPVMFTEHEVNALLTALKYLQKNPDTSVQENLNSIVTKIKSIIRYSAKEKAESLEDRMRVYSADNSFRTNLLSGIQAAITNCSVVHMSYNGLHSRTVSQRKVEPLAVYLTKENWIMIAHCRLRNDLREFRLDRILDLHASSETFPSRNFSFEEYIASFCKN